MEGFVLNKRKHQWKDRPFEEQISILLYTDFFLFRDGVQYQDFLLFTQELGPNPFYARNFTFITQEIMNTLLKKFQGP